MSESGDYVERHWDTSRDFAKVRQDYRRVVDHSMREAVSDRKVLTDMVPPNVVSKAAHAAILIFDETGSMQEAPTTMMSKNVYFQHVAHKMYIGVKGDIGIWAVGDHVSDDYYLQVQPFRRGKATEDSYRAIVFEGNGGGTGEESYGVPALYLARNASFPNAVRKPVVIFFGDEEPHDTVPADVARSVHVKTRSSISVTDIFAELREKVEPYLILRPHFGRGGISDPTNKRNFRVWSKLLGGDHRIAFLPEEARVMDVGLGILAQEYDKVPEFYDELETRQTPQQCEQVRRACRFIHADYFAKREAGGARRRKAKQPTKGLLDD